MPSLTPQQFEAVTRLKTQNKGVSRVNIQKRCCVLCSFYVVSVVAAAVVLVFFFFFIAVFVNFLHRYLEEAPVQKSK